MARVSIILVIFLSFFSVLAVSDRTKNVPDEIRLNPAIFLLSDVAENVFFTQSVEDRNKNIAKGNRSGIQPSRFMETNSMEPAKILPAKSNHPWNIVFFIMESVGTRYIFDTERWQSNAHAISS